MIGGPKPPTSCLARVISGEMDIEREKRKGWSNHGILVVDVDDRRLGWPEREMVKHLAKRLFGSQAVKEWDMDGKWTKETVANRLEEAASTLRRLPVIGLKPKEYGSSWPPVIHDVMEAYGDEPIIRLGPPPADAISRMDEVMEWLFWLEPEQVRLVWLRASRMPWKLIMRCFGIARSTASTRWETAIMQIAAILNLQQGKMSGHLSTGQTGQNFRDPCPVNFAMIA